MTNTPSRRDFLRKTASLSMASAVLPPAILSMTSNSFSSVQPAATPAGPAKLSILMLGGTGFLGPQTVDAALARGHSVTLFNRGRTNPGLFPQLEKLQGNRDPAKDEGLKALEGRKFDAVVDTSGYYPRIVKASAGLLSPNCGQYVFISSISVYSDNSKPDSDETSSVGTMEDPTVESMGDQFQYYGPLKALCEQAAEAAFPGRTTNLRPGLIVGRGDPTDRFTYWPARVSRGGEVLAPGNPSDPIQFIDAHDLGAWIIHCIENKIVGTFNAVGPERVYTIGELLQACKDQSGSDATFTWAPADWLESQGVYGWAHMPVWVAPKGEMAGFSSWSNRKAVAAGLKFRPVAETVADTLAWWKSLPQERRDSLGDPTKRSAGLTAAREAEVLAAWHQKQSEH